VLRLAEAFFAVFLGQRVVVMGKRKGKVRFVGPTAYGPGEWVTRCNDLYYYRASCVRVPLHYEVKFAQYSSTIGGVWWTVLNRPNAPSKCSVFFDEW